MPYEVTINTNNGTIREQIDDLKELEALLIKYYDVYTSVNTKKIDESEVKSKKR